MTGTEGRYGKWQEERKTEWRQRIEALLYEMDAIRHDLDMFPDTPDEKHAQSLEICKGMLKLRLDGRREDEIDAWVDAKRAQFGWRKIDRSMDDNK